MTEKITIYSTDNCFQCKMAKKYLTEHGKDFEEINLTQNPEFSDHVKFTLGYASAPVITIPVGLADLEEEFEKENSQQDRPPYLKKVDGCYVFQGNRPNYLGKVI